MQASENQFLDSAALEFRLFHGTSTLFLEGIREFGLGGKNPLKDWNVLECAKELLPLARKLLGESHLLEIDSFQRMAEQFSGAMNFQHGQTYLSPSVTTAARYATNNSHGSELLSYALLFARALEDCRAAGADEIFERYEPVAQLMRIHPAPLLIEVSGIQVKALQSEMGDHPQPTIEFLRDAARNDMFDVLSQQSNFRLLEAIPWTGLKVYLINVTTPGSIWPRFELYPLQSPVDLEGAVP